MVSSDMSGGDYIMGIAVFSFLFIQGLENRVFLNKFSSEKVSHKTTNRNFSVLGSGNVIFDAAFSMKIFY